MNYEFTKKPVYTELCNLSHKDVIDTLEELKNAKAFYMVKPLYATYGGNLYVVKAYGHLPADWCFDENDDTDYVEGNNDAEELKSMFNFSYGEEA